MSRHPLATAAVVALCALAASSAVAFAQQAQPKAAPPNGGTSAPATGLSASQDAEQKKAILASPAWRQAMFEFSEWLSAQPFYNKQQVEQIKARFNQRVHDMNSAELANMLADMEAKFQVINTPEAREARSWLGQYLSVLSDRKRAEVLKDVPNLATMTAAQLNQEISRIEAKRSNLEQEQSAFRQTQNAQIQAVQAQERQAANTYAQVMNTPTTGSYSPYRSPNQVNSRLNNARLGSGMSYYVGPWGGLGISFSPSSW